MTHASTEYEVLASLVPVVQALMEQHEAKRKLWFSSDFLPAGTTDQCDIATAELRARAVALPDEVRVSIALNLITEEGLPHFHRLLAVTLGQETIWGQWNNLWTAEEDRHGNVLRDYCRESRIFNFRALEERQFEYVRLGFNPNWCGDPYKIFAYTTLQERATQISHEQTGRTAGDYEPTIQTILRAVATDEARHFAFYANVFKELLQVDPNRALHAASEIMPRISMPAATISRYADYAEVVHRLGVYGIADYKRIVEQVISRWVIEGMTGLNEMGQKAQEKILSIPHRLERLSQTVEQKLKARSFTFDFLYDRLIAVGA